MIELSQREQFAISSHAERDYPYECCGLLLGTPREMSSKFVVEAFPISNAREEETKRNRFLIKPEELMRGERYASTKELEVLGFYHSHPDHPAIPSQYDLEHAWPTYSYIIISVKAGQARDLRSWTLEQDRSRFIEEMILKGS